MVNKAGKVVKEVALSDTYGKVDMLKNNYNNILRGLMKQEQRNNLASYSGEVRSFCDLLNFFFLSLFIEYQIFKSNFIHIKIFR